MVCYKIHYTFLIQFLTLNSHRVIQGSWERVPFGNCLRKIAIFVDIRACFHDSKSVRMVLSGLSSLPVNIVWNWNSNVLMMYFMYDGQLDLLPSLF